MLINGHAHVFTLESVLSKEAIAIMVARLRGFLKHDFIADAVEEFLEGQLDHPEYLIEDELLVRFMELISKQAGFRKIAAQLPVEVRHIGAPGEELGVALARTALNKLSGWIDAQDGPGKSPYDVFETLRIAMQPNIPRVAGKLLAHLGPEDAIVALMMDIVAAKEPERDRRNFRKQIRGTMDAALAYPGRVLPFIAVNPARADHFEVMRRAIEEQGFVGVKLYPSLGYEVGTREMDAVLKYCSGKDVPITIHTSSGGFYKNETTAGYCDPVHWTPLLVSYPELRVCFAHCGGWGGLCNHDPGQAKWAARIFQHMAYTGVYADISYHVDFMFAGPQIEKKYLDALKALIDDSARGERVVWGTDSWLLRLNMDDAAYWRYFRANLGKDAAGRDRFEKIAGENARRFVGLPDASGAGARDNIKRHVVWLEEHAKDVGAQPSAWVRALTKTTFGVTRGTAEWNPANRAHALAYKHFLESIPRRLKGNGFEDAGHLRMRQLNWFAASGKKPTKKVLRDQVDRLVSLCESRGPEIEAGHTATSIADGLTDLLTDGNTTMIDVGNAVDAYFLFKDEI